MSETITTATADQLVERIRDYAVAAVEAGFIVHVPQTPWTLRKAGFVYVTKDDAPGIAMIQVPTHAFEDVSVDVPVKPSKVYGSAVMQDHDGTVADVLRLLGELMESGTVVPRFVGPHGPVAVDRAIGFDAVPLAV